MVEFLTIFLGLVVGVQPIEVTVGPGVARVEFLLDGVQCGVAEEPPWQVPCSFGATLVPHRLEAVARDLAGIEIARVEQWINLPRRRAEATLSLEAPVDGRARRARLIWEALDFDRPQRVEIVFDGRPLTAFDGRWIELPKYDPETIHILSAELEFSDRVAARADIVFGGEYGDRIASELTAIAVERTGRRIPRAADLDGSLVVGEEPLRVVAVERPPLDLVVVREQSASLFEALERLVTVGGSQRVPVRALLPRVLHPADRVRFVFPTAAASRGQSTVFELMPISTALTTAPAHSAGSAFERRRANDRTLFQILTGSDFPAYRESLPEQRLADAVGVGGLVAAAGNRRRAVLLLTTGESVDSSRLAPPVTRHYLDSLTVPLTVWRLRPPGRPGAATDPAWGNAPDVIEWGDFAAAYRELRESLDRQMIVWVEGRHLPQDVRIADAAADVALARRSSEELAAALAAATVASIAPRRAPPARSRERIEMPDAARIESARAHLTGDPLAAQLGPLRLLTDLEAPRLIRALHRIATQAPQLYADHYGLPGDLAGGATAVLFADEASYRAFEIEAGAGGGELAGHATSGLIALHAGSRAPSEIEATFLHELVHLLNIRAFGPDLEPWLDEGLADAMALAGTRGGRLVLEPLDPRRPALAMRSLEGPLSQLGMLLDAAEAGRLPRLDELVRLDRATFTARADAAILYPLSALWVHYLGSLAPESELFREFLVHRSQNPARGGSSLAGALGASFEQLEVDFRRWLEALGRALLPA